MPLRDHVQPVLAKSMDDARTAMYRFYASWQACYESEPDHSGKHVYELPLIVINGDIIKVE